MSVLSIHLYQAVRSVALVECVGDYRQDEDQCVLCLLGVHVLNGEIPIHISVQVPNYIVTQTSKVKGRHSIREFVRDI